MNWPLQDAKNRFSEVVSKARQEGPQTVTRRGVRAAVVISAEEFDRLTSEKPTLADYLLTGQTWDDESVEEVNRRNPSHSRDVAL
jgi:prevent-host-death family protein